MGYKISERRAHALRLPYRLSARQECKPGAWPNVFLKACKTDATMFSLGLYDLEPTKRKILLDDKDGKRQDPGFFRASSYYYTIILIYYVLTPILG